MSKMRVSSKSDGIETRIFKLLHRERDALTYYAIAKKLKIPLSTARYFTKRMAKSGVLVEIEDGKKKLYGLHPVFFNKGFWDNFIANLEGAMKTISHYTLNYEYNSIDLEYTLKLLIGVLKK